MLTGQPTVAATFAATAHRHRDRPARIDVFSDGGRRTTSWATVVRTVRHAAVGLAGAGLVPGDAVSLDAGAPPAHRSAVLLVAAATGAVATGGRGEVLDLESLGVAGARVDDRHPDRFEALVAGRQRHEVLLCAGGVSHTHASLLVAARSFAQGAALGPDDGLLVSLRPGTATEAVLAVLVPALTGATAWTSEADPGLVVAHEGVTMGVSSDPLPDPPARRWRRRTGVPGWRHVRVVGDGEDAGAPADRVATALCVDAAGGVVSAFGPPGSVGRPLPGVSIAVADDEVLVRSCGIPSGGPGLGADGWLATGRRGRLERGALVLDPPPASGGAT